MLCFDLYASKLLLEFVHGLGQIPQAAANVSLLHWFAFLYGLKFPNFCGELSVAPCRGERTNLFLLCDGFGASPKGLHHANSLDLPDSLPSLEIKNVEDFELLVVKEHDVLDPDEEEGVAQ